MFYSCRNIRGLSPLEAATNRGHFDCARWLWLNQWSVSITKEVFTPLKEKENRKTSYHKGPQLINLANQNHVSSENSSTTSSISSKQDSGEKPTSFQEIKRPQTAVYSRRLQTLDSKIPPRVSSAQSKLPNQRNSNSIKPKQKVSTNGLHSAKTKQILAYYTSKKEHNASIPGKTVDFTVKITNTSSSSEAHRNAGNMTYSFLQGRLLDNV